MSIKLSDLVQVNVDNFALPSNIFASIPGLYPITASMANASSEPESFTSEPLPADAPIKISNLRK